MLFEKFFIFILIAELHNICHTFLELGLRKIYNFLAKLAFTIFVHVTA